MYCHRLSMILYTQKKEQAKKQTSEIQTTYNLNNNHDK